MKSAESLKNLVRRNSYPSDDPKMENTKKNIGVPNRKKLFALLFVFISNKKNRFLEVPRTKTA